MEKREEFLQKKPADLFTRYGEKMGKIFFYSPCNCLWKLPVDAELLAGGKMLH